MDTIQRKDLSTEKQNVESLNIDELSIIRILELINNEDASIPNKIAASLAEIEQTVDLCIQSLKSNGRIFYIGAGTSGRLGVLDASEIPPTFSAPNDLFTGIIAGGDKALKNSIEGAEDDPEQAIKDLKNHNIKKEDVLIGISSSGAARYVQSALDYAKSIKAKIVYITCNKTPYLHVDADVAIALETGPEIITGSTRMKAGTATKMVLNMISSATMIKLGKVYGNLMVDLMTVNDKLVDRGCRIISQLTNVDEIVARRTLVRSKMSVKTAIVMIYHSIGYDKAKKMIDDSDGMLRKIIS